MADLAAASHLLRSVFGFAAFRDGQAEIIETILAGRDVLAVMPTGSGKSLRNQVAQLRGYGIAAAALNSANGFAENRGIIEQIARGELRLAYIAPERLANPEIMA